HLHRTLDGTVVAGPNAVLAGKREGYRRRDVSPRDLAEVLTYGGFWRLARRLGRPGMAELPRAPSKRPLLRAAPRLLPALPRAPPRASGPTPSTATGVSPTTPPSPPPSVRCTCSTRPRRRLPPACPSASTSPSWPPVCSSSAARELPADEEEPTLDALPSLPLS